MLKDDLETKVKTIFEEKWNVETALKIPELSQVRLGNHAKDLETATVLYADMDGSTDMVDNYSWEFCAEVYKAYLECAAKIIKSEEGVITAYDGDRIMAVFTGGCQRTHAVEAALKINYAVSEIIQPAINRRQPYRWFHLGHVIGIDTSPIKVARIGVRGDNDFVWVGRAANYAAKLTGQSGESIWITESVYRNMNDSVKFKYGFNIWSRSHKTMKGTALYTTREKKSF